MCIYPFLWLSPKSQNLILVFEQAYYNWAIAISDRAKMRGRTKEAEELWKQVQPLDALMLYFHTLCSLK